VYTPAQFAEPRLSELQELIRTRPFATVVASSAQGLEAEHLPLLLDASRGSYGVLQGHVARANPIWQSLGEGTQVLAIFQGPHHYISPSWYPAKAEHGRVVPTWNYVVVHGYGTLSWIHDPDWLRDLLDRLTNSQEAEREQPWHLDDAPPEFVTRMLEGIVGFEISLSALDGKCKLSQNRSAPDQAGVVAGLLAESNDMAIDIAHRMRNAGP